MYGLNYQANAYISINSPNLDPPAAVFEPNMELMFSKWELP
jgi:hypothetical protein